MTKRYPVGASGQRSTVFVLSAACGSGKRLGGVLLLLAPTGRIDRIREALKPLLRGLILAQNRKTLAMRALGQGGVDYDANIAK